MVLLDLPKEEHFVFNDKTIKVKEFIPAKHKLFMFDIEEGDPIIRYRVLIAKMQYDVKHG